MWIDSCSGFGGYPKKSIGLVYPSGSISKRQHSDGSSSFLWLQHDFACDHDIVVERESGGGSKSGSRHGSIPEPHVREMATTTTFGGGMRLIGLGHHHEDCKGFSTGHLNFFFFLSRQCSYSSVFFFI